MLYPIRSILLRTPMIAGVSWTTKDEPAPEPNKPVFFLKPEDFSFKDGLCLVGDSAKFRKIQKEDRILLEGDKDWSYLVDGVASTDDGQAQIQLRRARPITNYTAAVALFA